MEEELERLQTENQELQEQVKELQELLSVALSQIEELKKQKPHLICRKAQ